jgi:hypothetical protein
MLQGRGAGWTNRTSAPRLQGETSATEGKPAGNGQTDDRSVAHRQGETEERSSNFWTFHFSNSLAEKGRTHAKTHRRGVRRAVKLDPVVLVFRAICPSPACRRRDWPCAGYSGLVIPGSGLLVCWSEPQTRECRQSLGRLLGRAAVIRAEYERIERIGSSQRGNTHIHRRRKIKAKPASISNSR